MQASVVEISKFVFPFPLTDSHLERFPLHLHTILLRERHPVVNFKFVDVENELQFLEVARQLRFAWSQIVEDPSSFDGASNVRHTHLENNTVLKMKLTERNTKQSLKCRAIWGHLDFVDPSQSASIQQHLRLVVAVGSWLRLITQRHVVVLGPTHRQITKINQTGFLATNVHIS